MKTEIIVAEDEISIAQRGLNTRCAITAAIMNRIPSARYIKVTKDTISYLDTNRGLRFKFETPAVAAQFIERWDRSEPNDPIAPIGFWLTEQALISCRPPRKVSTSARIKRTTTPPPIREPGSRMKRTSNDQTCATS